jgi:L-malate glycosyltransferase
MTILIITPLFPDTVDTPRTETTFAVYDFVKYWGEHKVVVIKPRKSSFRRVFSERNRTGRVGDIEVLSVPYFKVSALQKVFPGLFANRARKALRLRAILPDVVISHYHLSILFGYKIARAFSLPFLPVIHKRDIQEMRDGRDYIYRNSLPAATTILIRSHALKKRFLEYYPGFSEKLQTVTSGIPMEYVLPKKDYFRKVRGVGERKVLRLVTAASLIPLKNHAFVISALASLTARDFVYEIVGDGPERSAIEIEVEKHGLTDKVIFVGRLTREGVLEKLRDSDIFVMVSNNETFGIAYLEALAKACIVVGARGWGIDGIVNHAENGFLCEPKNSEAIADVLTKIATMSETELAELGRRMYQTIQTLDETSVSQRYLDIVESAVARNS